MRRDQWDDLKEDLKLFGTIAVSVLAATLPPVAFAIWMALSGASPWWLLSMPFWVLWSLFCLIGGRWLLG